MAIRTAIEHRDSARQAGDGLIPELVWCSADHVDPAAAHLTHFKGALDGAVGAEAECAVNKRKYELTVRQQEIVLKLAQLDKELVDTYPLPVDRKDAALALKSAAMDLKASEDDAASYDELVRRGLVAEAMRKKKLPQITTNNIN